MTGLLVLSHSPPFCFWAPECLLTFPSHSGFTPKPAARVRTSPRVAGEGRVHVHALSCDFLSLWLGHSLNFPCACQFGALDTELCESRACVLPPSLGAWCSGHQDCMCGGIPWQSSG